MSDLTKHASLTRLGEGSEADAKREFAQRFNRTLDDLGVTPGMVFILMPPLSLTMIRADVSVQKERVAKLEDELVDAQHAEHLLELIEDFDRGIIGRDELIEKAHGPL